MIIVRTLPALADRSFIVIREAIAGAKVQEIMKMCVFTVKYIIRGYFDGTIGGVRQYYSNQSDTER